MTYTDLELLEQRELEKIENLLNVNFKYIVAQFDTKRKLENYWKSFYGGTTGGISEASIGIERIMYKIFSNYGNPVAVPVGSDLFFELEDCFVHIDIKSFVTANIGDARGNIPVADNQNSYSGKIIVRGRPSRSYTPNLPTIYKYYIDNILYQKPCLTFFIVFINDENTHEILGNFVTCMPNGLLYSSYGDRILSAGKTPGKIRFNYANLTFENIFDRPLRTKLIYYDGYYVKKDFIN